MEWSIGHLMKVAKDFYMVSMGINEINDGIKNPKRFRLIIWHIIYLPIFTLINHLFAISNYFYSLLKTDFLPGHFRRIVFGFALGILWFLVIWISF